MILNPNPRQTDSAKTRARNTCMHIWIVTDAAQDDVRKYRHGSLLFTQNSASCLGRKPQGAQPMDVGEHVEDPGLRTTSPSQSFSSPPSKPKGVVGCPASASTKNRGATSPVCNKVEALRLKTKPRGLAWFVSFHISSNIFWPAGRGSMIRSPDQHVYQLQLASS
jgi:hypothetical protein